LEIKEIFIPILIETSAKLHVEDVNLKGKETIKATFFLPLEPPCPRPLNALKFKVLKVFGISCIRRELSRLNRAHVLQI
jgi:hypothetical protein